MRKPSTERIKIKMNRNEGVNVDIPFNWSTRLCVGLLLAGIGIGVCSYGIGNCVYSIAAAIQLRNTP